MKKKMTTTTEQPEEATMERAAEPEQARALVDKVVDHLVMKGCHEVTLPDQNPPGNLLACPNCNQEMFSPDETLPLHMAEARMCIGSGTPGAPPKFGQQICQPLTIADVSKLSASEVLSANSCWSCGQAKVPGQTLCTTDYGLLPFIVQKMLPPRVRGYLYVDEKSEVAGIDKKQFMEVFQSALTQLAALRSVAQ